MDGIHKSLFINAPKDRVWQCLIRPQALEKWMCATPEGSCSDFKLTVGSTIILADPPSGPWDGKMIWRIVALEEPSQIEFSFFHNLIGEETQLIFKLEDEAKGTRLQLLHSGFENTVGDGVKNRDDHEGGWKDHLNRLKAQSEAH
jgi:uncharacterized protein YndB with AHSA1/START domain